MKIQLTFKTTCVASDTLVDLTEEEYDHAMRTISKYVKHDEYVSIEVDTKTGAAIVLPVKK